MLSINDFTRYIQATIYRNESGDFAKSPTVPTVQEATRNLWTVEQYNQKMQSAISLKYYVDIVSNYGVALVALAAVITIVAGLALSFKAVAAGVVGLLFVKFIMRPVCDKFETYFVAGPFVKQASLRTELLWHHGFTADTWKPIMNVGGMPDELRDATLEKLNSSWQVFKQYRSQGERTAMYLSVGDWIQLDVTEFKRKVITPTS